MIMQTLVDFKNIQMVFVFIPKIYLILLAKKTTINFYFTSDCLKQQKMVFSMTIWVKMIKEVIFVTKKGNASIIVKIIRTCVWAYIHIALLFDENNCCNQKQ
jgi:hypothetical protein